jgi:Fur family ferric uptake transcriptional regulator
MKNPEELLKHHRVRVTEIRKDIVSALLTRDFALSCKEIKENIPNGYDRVTFYRTLNTFVEEGIIHQITGSDGISRYALCSSGECVTHHHEDRHIHFQCSGCNQTFCLNYHDLPKISIPEGYQINTIDISATGLCKGCS